MTKIKYTEAELDKMEKAAAESEGKWKMGYVAANIFTGGAVGLTFSAAAILSGTASLITAFGAKIAEKILPTGYGKQTCKEASQKLSSWGTKAFVIGVGAPLFLFEGPYNYMTGERKYGVMPTARWLAKKVSGIQGQTEVEKIKEAQKAREEEEKIKQQKGIEMIKQQSATQPPALNTTNVSASSRQSEERKQPAPPATEIAIEQIKQAPNFTEANKAYTKILESSPEREFQVASDETDPKTGITTRVFYHPDHTKGDDAKAHQVTYIIDKEGKTIGITHGAKATCILPPIDKGNGDCEVVGLNAGVKKKFHDTNPAIISNIVQAEQAAVDIERTKAPRPRQSEIDTSNSNLPRKSTSQLVNVR